MRTRTADALIGLLVIGALVVTVAAIIVWVVWCTVTLGAAAAVWHHSWLVAAALAVVSGGLKLLVLSRMQRLSNRWLVVVPAGSVMEMKKPPSGRACTLPGRYLSSDARHASSRGR